MLMRTGLIALLFTLVLAAPGGAVGVTGRLDVVETEAAARRDALDGDPDMKRAVRSFGRVLRVLGKSTADQGYAQEVKTAGKAAKLTLKRLTTETALLDGLAAARDGYRDDLLAARDRLAALVASPGKGDKTTKKRQKQLRKADRQLGKAGAIADIDRELMRFAQAAKTLEEYVEFGGSGGGGGEVIAESYGALVFGSDVDYDGNRSLYIADLEGWAAPLSESFGEGHHVPDFRLSPTDDTIAVAISGVADAGLWLLRPEATEPLRLSAVGETFVRNLYWSPDGTRIAYLVGDPPALAIVDPDGENHRVLSQPGADVVGPVEFAADGRILYRSDRDGSRHYEVRSVMPDGTGGATLSSTASPAGTIRYVSFSLSPNGDQVAYASDHEVSGSNELFLARPDGTGIMQVSTEAGTTGSIGGNDFKWASDGSGLFYRRELMDTGADGLFFGPADGGTPTRMSPKSEDEVSSFEVDPVNLRIAFRFGDTTLYLGTPGANPVEVATAGYMGSMLWAPNGGRLAWWDAADILSDRTLRCAAIPPVGSEDPIETKALHTPVTGRFDFIEAPVLKGPGQVLFTTADGCYRVPMDGSAPAQLVSSNIFDSPSVTVEATGQLALHREYENGPFGEVTTVQVRDTSRPDSLPWHLPQGDQSLRRFAPSRFLRFLREANRERVLSFRRILRFADRIGMELYEQDITFGIYAGVGLAINHVNLGQSARLLVEYLEAERDGAGGWNFEGSFTGHDNGFPGTYDLTIDASLRIVGEYRYQDPQKGERVFDVTSD